MSRIAQKWRFGQRRWLEKLGLQCWAKSSGSKGLQLYVPLNTPVTYELTKSFAKAMALSLEKTYPDRVVSDMKKALRSGKVLVDWSQNGPSKTTVCVYSLRAKARPFVSAPVTWEEVANCYRKDDPHLLFFEPQKSVAAGGENGRFVCRSSFGCTSKRLRSKCWKRFPN